METLSNKEIYSEREINTSLENLYDLFSMPDFLKKWWGPEGFTNTFHEFDLRPEGKWLTMHGPDSVNYENSAIFNTVKPLEMVSWTRLSQPLFNMEVGFKKMSQTRSKISFRMIFKTSEDCDNIKAYVLPKNEENFDRLEKLIK